MDYFVGEIVGVAADGDSESRLEWGGWGREIRGFLVPTPAPSTLLLFGTDLIELAG